ncbi:MAG: DUF1993 domain-containing protein [Hyphomicrobium sp.]|jgi:hypothetical protein
MSVTMYQIAVPSFQKHLHALDGIIDKAMAYAAAKKIAPETLLTARLYPDMFNFTRQVQESCKFASLSVQRLANIDVVAEADGEKTFEDLKARIARTIDLLASVKPEQMDGSDERQITIKVGPNEMSFSGRDYLLHFALPNFYFHASTAYGILRHNGVEIGKRDFMRRT